MRGNLTRFVMCANGGAWSRDRWRRSSLDAGFARDAATVLPTPPWDASTWKAWTEAVKAKTGAKGKALFMPLRLALTGVEHGPELAALLPLIGPERAAARLSGKPA